MKLKCKKCGNEWDYKGKNPYCPFGTSMKEPWDEADPYTIQKVIEAIKRWGAI